MKYFFLFLFTISLTSCNAQQEITATKNKQGDLIGFANKESFNQAPYNSWFHQNFDTYKPDATTISSLKEALKGVTIKAFMGTWCGDSKRETPHFYKVLELADFNLKNVEMVTVNRSKRTPDNLQEGLDIKRVPTFIFIKDGKEIGRYVEYARESLEKDMLKIVSGEAYKHSYDSSK
ncbi:TlpA family protein disulfide reductase [Polaribacter sp. IC073]|uniref:TlpA family protein disulfide reductase n=1 Tax=Polaribacter sp. IC073 TaxID=2508540 RepID=UPI0011BDFCD6|nr:thioredoxin family protein [Polaribacter sp. IC073]TXD46876.1 thioredoxin family protein [Polaribacter sp. IC073]